MSNSYNNVVKSLHFRVVCVQGSKDQKSLGLVLSTKMNWDRARDCMVVIGSLSGLVVSIHVTLNLSVFVLVTFSTLQLNLILAARPYFI